MKLKVDKESNALYFRLDENAIVESEEVRPGVILDFDKNGRVVGVEFLDIAEFRFQTILPKDFSSDFVLQLDLRRSGYRIFQNLLGYKDLDNTSKFILKTLT